MENGLSQIRQTVMDGIRLSKQSSYGRRAPALEALPSFEEARSQLHDFVRSHPDSREGWVLLAHTEECLLHFSEARRCLEQAMKLSGTRSRSDLKKLALYTEMEKEWSELLLTPSQLRALGAYLRRKPSKDVSRRSFRWTETWLRAHGFEDTRKVIESIRARGAFDDFQVSENFARG